MKNYQEYLEMLENLTGLKGLDAEVYNAIGFKKNPLGMLPPIDAAAICDEIEKQRGYHLVYVDGGVQPTEFGLIPVLLAILVPREFRRWWFERKVSAIVDRLTDPEMDRLRRLEDGRLVRSYGDWPEGKQTS